MQRKCKKAGNDAHHVAGQVWHPNERESCEWIKK